MHDALRATRIPLFVSLVVGVLLLAWYGGTVSEMRAVWDGSETYQHGYAVLPISLWLMWRARARILTRDFSPAWVVSLVIALAGLAWLVGELSAVGTIKHFALVAMVLASVWLIWGHRAAAAAVFPMAFLFFAVPFGDFLVPTLTHYTAEFTVSALRLTGIPVYREGLSFVIPSGSWSVVEACSGIRYLLASVMVGALYAYLTYVSPWRRLAFVGVSFVVPLVANWLRAYMIVMLGHLSGNRLAVGVDHLIYGWVFFGIVIFAMFWIGGRWAENPPPAPGARGAGRVATPARFVVAAVAALLIGSLWLPLAKWLMDAPVAEPVALVPFEGKGGWNRVDKPAVRWEPDYNGWTRGLKQAYVKNGEAVQLIVYVYAGQRNGRKLLQWNNRLVAEEGKGMWEVVAEKRTAIDLADGPIEARQIRLKGDGYVDAWHWLVVDGRATTSASNAKLSLLKDRMTRQSDYSAAVFVASPEAGGQAPERVRQFLLDNADEISAMLARAER